MVCVLMCAHEPCACREGCVHMNRVQTWRVRECVGARCPLTVCKQLKYVQRLLHEEIIQTRLDDVIIFLLQYVQYYRSEASEQRLKKRQLTTQANLYNRSKIDMSDIKHSL